MSPTEKAQREVKQAQAELDQAQLDWLRSRDAYKKRNDKRERDIAICGVVIMFCVIMPHVLVGVIAAWRWLCTN